jgi:RNA polymerase sigma factor (sigma-70 family)
MIDQKDFESHWPLARKLALSFARKATRDKREDFLSVARVKLCEILQSPTFKDHPNKPAYVNQMIRGECRDFLLNDHVVRVPKSNTGQIKNPPAVYTMVDVKQDTNLSDDGIFAGTEQPKYFLTGREDERMRLEEALMLLDLKRQHRDIIRLKFEGYNDSDVATRLGVSRQMVLKHMRVIREAYIKAQREHKETLIERKEP